MMRPTLRPSARRSAARGATVSRAALAVAAGMVVSTATAPGLAAQDVMRSEHHSYRVVTVAEGLENPWSIAFLPGGDLLITERPGRLRLVSGGVLQPEPIAGVPEVRARGQGGLLDVVLHPDYESNRLVYLSYSKPRADGQGTTAIIRGRFDGAALTDVEEIFEAVAWSDGGNHFGSRIVFDADGYMFFTVGDRGASPFMLAEHPSQHLDNHQGTVNRLHDDGRVPDDNPFVGQAGALPSIWSYGHRNMQGLAIDSRNGNLWDTEHGPQGGDELNLILPGRNYGWPVIGYGVQYGGRPIHESAEMEGMTQPARYWVPSIATSGLIIYDGDAFPEWRGSAFVGGLAGQQIARVTLDGDRAVSEETLLEGTGRVRDIRQAPNGDIYVALDDRRGGPTSVVRLEPAGSR